MCCNCLRNYRKTTIVFGCLLALAGILLFSLSGKMIEAIVKAKLVLKPDSMTYDFWKSVPIPIYYSVYMFNVSNAKDVMSTGATPKLQEVGPFVFEVKQEKTNIKFNSNGTVTYKQKKIYHFASERSPNVSMSDMIYHLNVVLVAASSVIHYKYRDDPFLNYVINTVCNDSSVDCSLFVKHNVSELLFEGYPDPMIQGSAQVFNMPFTKFGFFVNRNDTPGTDGVFNTFTGDSDINKLGLLDKWNHSSTLGVYANKSKCDRFDYSSAGDFRPPYLMKDNSDPIYMFIGDVARSFRLDYHKDEKVNGIDCKRYEADQHLFDYEIEENRCFCLSINNQTVCPDNGAANVSATSFGAPVFVSFPHFLYANESYRKHLDGLHPDPKKHGFFMDFEPTLAVPMKAHANIQINIMVERNNFIDRMNGSYVKFDRLLIPQLWTGISVDIDDDMASKLKIVLKTLPLICIILSSVLVLCGLLLLFSLIYFKYLAKNNSNLKNR